MSERVSLMSGDSASCSTLMSECLSLLSDDC